jgi:hypothetical protein
MASIAPERNPSLHLLSDHLNAALALGEDLLGAELLLDAPDRPGVRGWLRQTRELDAFVGSARTLEYAMTARLLQARKRAEDLRRTDSRLKPLIALFVAGTVPLVDAAVELGDADARDFDGADAALSFLRSRGLLASDAAGLELLSRLSVGEDYLVAGRIPLGTLLDLVAGFLDALDTLYGMPVPVAAIEPGPMYSARALEAAAGRSLEPSALN